MEFAEEVDSPHLAADYTKNTLCEKGAEEGEAEGCRSLTEQMRQVDTRHVRLAETDSYCSLSLSEAVASHWVHARNSVAVLVGVAIQMSLVVDIAQALDYFVLMAWEARMA